MYIFGIIYVPYILLWILCVVMMLFAYTFYKQSHFRRLGIDGPRPTPFFGDLGKIKEQGMYARDIWLAREYGGAVATYYGNFPTLLITDPEIIGEVCVKQFSKFYDRTEIVRISDQWRKSLNNARGAMWKFLRTVLNPTFSSGKIRNMEPVLRRCLDDFTDVLHEKAANNDEVDVLKIFSALTMDIVCTTSFGIEIDSQKNPDNVFVKHASKILATGLHNPIILLNFLFPDFREIIMFFAKDYTDKHAMAFLRKAVSMAIAERRESGESSRYSDLLKLMLDSRSGNLEADRDESGLKMTFEAYKNRGMTDDEIIMNSIIFLAAGYDTTSVGMSWLSYCLATHQDCQERLIDEIDSEIGPAGTLPTYDKLMKLQYLDMVVCETLRMYAPAARFNREASCDVTIKDLHIPKGTDVSIAIHGVHHNPKYWPDPDTFNPDRFAPENKSNIVPYSYIPFGAGPKNCVGQKLALVEIKFATVLLLQNVRVLPSVGTGEPSKKGGILLKPDKMMLKLTPRSQK